MQVTNENNRITGFHRGVVMDNNDPEKWGRCRINVHGFFDDITETSHLPWAAPILPLWSGAGAGHGWFSVPDVGTTVMCFFEAGDIYQPVYFGEAPDGVRGHPAEGDTNYPNRRGFKTGGGHIIFIDDTADIIQIEHNEGSLIQITPTVLKLTKAGASIEIDASGNITISGTKVDINP